MIDTNSNNQFGLTICGLRYSHAISVVDQNDRYRGNFLIAAN